MRLERDHTRSRVIDLLRRGPLTLDELAAELSVTRTAIRLQLTALERDGHVARRGIKRGKTKPSQVYELTAIGERELSRAYIPVLTELLHVLSDRLDRAEFESVMRAVGRRLVDSRPAARGTARARVDQASELLNQFGGLTEVDEEGPDLLIRSHGCPLAATAVDHPETCSAMESLVSEFVGASVTQECDRSDRPRCRFRLANAGRGSAA
jgi:predicted ArsR family transcriptional regulator